MKIEYYQKDINACFKLNMILNQFNNSAQDIAFGFTLPKSDDKEAVCGWKLKAVKKIE